MLSSRPHCLCPVQTPPLYLGTHIPSLVSVPSSPPDGGSGSHAQPISCPPPPQSLNTLVPLSSGFLPKINDFEVSQQLRPPCIILLPGSVIHPDPSGGVCMSKCSRELWSRRQCLGKLPSPIPRPDLGTARELVPGLLVYKPQLLLSLPICSLGHFGAAWMVAW